MLPLDIAYGPSVNATPVAIVVALVAVAVIVFVLWMLLHGRR